MLIVIVNSHCIAIGIRFLADLFGLNIAIHLVAFLAIASGIFVLTVMKETSRR